MKRVILFSLLLIIFLIGGSFFFFFRGSYNEPTSIGNDALIVCAQTLYAGLVRAGVELDSQCLGTCDNYVVDLVHVPRIPSDDLPENQCRLYREGLVQGFIELDAHGTVVRINP